MFEDLFDRVTFDDLFALDDEENTILWEKLLSATKRIRSDALRGENPYSDIFDEIVSIRSDLTNIFLGRTY